VNERSSSRVLRKTLERQLAGAKRVVLLAVGSDLRGDDGAGTLTAELLSEREPTRLAVVRGATAPENLTGEIRGLQPTHLVVVDAVEMGRRPGAVALVPLAELAGEAASTHRLPLGLTLSFLAHELGCDLLVIGIQPRSTSLGAAMSPEVSAAAKEVASLLRELLDPAAG